MSDDWLSRLPDPRRCEMCGGIKDAESPAQYSAQETITWLVNLWVEHPQAPGFLLARVGFPDWSFDQIASMMGVSKSTVGRVAKLVYSTHPEVEGLCTMFRGPRSGDAARNKVTTGRTRSEAQRERRKREAMR